MNSLQISCFLAAAETLNFTEAAQRLFFTQQAVSKAISNLGEELGVALFTREKKKLCLTRAGEYYVWLFQKNLMQLDEAREELGFHYQHMGRRLSLGYSEWVDPFGEINRGVKAFRREKPQVSVSATQYPNVELSEKLRSGVIDIAFLSEDQIVLNNDFETCPIAREDLSLLVPERVCGPGWSGEPDKSAWGAHFMQAMAWEWSYLEKQQIIEKELASLGLSPPAVDFLPNIHSLLAELETGRCVTVGDVAFGLFGKVPGIRARSLGIDSWLYCIWYKLNENPVIPVFIEHIKNFYAPKAQS